MCSTIVSAMCFVFTGRESVMLTLFPSALWNTPGTRRSGHPLALADAALLPAYLPTCLPYHLHSYLTIYLPTLLPCYLSTFLPFYR